MKKVILHLNLISKWFDLVEAGIKKEEYREIKPFWDRIFSTGKVRIKGKYYNPEEVTIVFSNGYAKDRRQIHCNLLELRKGFGKSEWGADPLKPYYILEIQPEEDSHEEVICCPECGTVQVANVLHSVPFATYIHHCIHCEYVIMESDWDRVEMQAK